MAVYFFHHRNDVDVLLDPDGRELPAEKVRPAALAEARAIVAAEAREGCINLHQEIEVRDAEGKLVYRLDFNDAVQLVSRPS